MTNDTRAQPAAAAEPDWKALYGQLFARALKETNGDPLSPFIVREAYRLGQQSAQPPAAPWPTATQKYIDEHYPLPIKPPAVTDDARKILAEIEGALSDSHLPVGSETLFRWRDFIRLTARSSPPVVEGWRAGAEAMRQLIRDHIAATAHASAPHVLLADEEGGSEKMYAAAMALNLMCDEIDAMPLPVAPSPASTPKE